MREKIYYVIYSSKEVSWYTRYTRKAVSCKGSDWESSGGGFAKNWIRVGELFLGGRTILSYHQGQNKTKMFWLGIWAGGRP